MVSIEFWCNQLTFFGRTTADLLSIGYLTSIANTSWVICHFRSTVSSFFIPSRFTEKPQRLAMAVTSFTTGVKNRFAHVFRFCTYFHCVSTMTGYWISIDMNKS